MEFNAFYISCLWLFASPKITQKKVKKSVRASVFVIAPGALWAYGLIDQ
jgi:hypothetical protein